MPPPPTALEGQIHFIASKDFQNIDFFQNITEENSSYDFSNLKVYINGELTTQVANSISANANDDIVIKATSGKYPWFGHYTNINSRYDIDYIKSIEEPLPLMHRADGNPITNFYYCFYDCSSLTSIPEGLFDNNTKVTSFNSCFDSCFSLTSIPEGLFDNNTKVTNFGSCFVGCSSLTSIPAGLFDNNPNVTNFSYCFYNCSGLASIPEGLFDNNTQVTSFRDCFYGCSSLTIIPAGLFDNNPLVTNFSYCFRNCYDLTTIPEGLFDNNPNVTDFRTCFGNCYDLTSIPVGLFDKNTQVTDFSYCFQNCSKLTVNVQIGSTASSVGVTYFASNTKSKGTVYCRAGSVAYTKFAGTSNANVNVLTY